MIDLIYTSGNNMQYAHLTSEARWLIGIRSDEHAYNVPIQFVDCNYKAPDFEQHVALVRHYTPRYATVPDLSESEISQHDIARAVQQVEVLSPYCETVFIIPKLPGQIALLPPHIAIGYSVPTSYGGAHYPLWELEGRKVHLLGGSPHTQIHLYRYISCFATIVSADGNMFQLMSGFGKYWANGRWVKHPRRGEGETEVSYECITWSLRNIRRAWLKELYISLCPSCCDQLGSTWSCVFCQDARSDMEREQMRERARMERAA